MKTLLITLIITTLISMGIKLGSRFEEQYISSRTLFITFIIQILLLIWYFTLLNQLTL